MSDSWNFIRKECSLSLDRSSTRTLWVPGRWTAANKLPNASAKKTHLSRCIICLSLLYLLLRTAITAALSHRAITCLPRHRCPQITLLQSRVLWLQCSNPVSPWTTPTETNGWYAMPNSPRNLTHWRSDGENTAQVSP